MNATYFNIISTAVMGILLIMFIWAFFKKQSEYYNWVFNIMFVMVIAHAALSLTVTFTAPNTVLDATI